MNEPNLFEPQNITEAPQADASHAMPNTPTSKPNEPPGTSKGSILKKARESQGLSLELVHEITKIPMDALRAIEEGYTIRTMSPFYYKGFLKIYATYLNIDISEVVDTEKQETLPKTDTETSKTFEELELTNRISDFLSPLLTRRNKQRAVIAISAIIILFLSIKIIAFLIPNRSEDNQRIKQTKINTSSRTPVTRSPISKTKKSISNKIKPISKTQKKVPAVKVKKTTPVQKTQKKLPPKPKVIPQKISPVKPVTRTSTPAVTKPAQQATSITPETPKVAKNVTLTVRAKKNSWLRVKTDGQTVFQSTLRLGTVETWMANEKIEISGKNINQLEFELNGKLIGSLGRRDRRAKRVVITKDGLTVSK